MTKRHRYAVNIPRKLIKCHAYSKLCQDVELIKIACSIVNCITANISGDFAKRKPNFSKKRRDHHNPNSNPNPNVRQRTRVNTLAHKICKLKW